MVPSELEKRLAELRAAHPEEFITLNDPDMVALVPHVSEDDRLVAAQDFFSVASSPRQIPDMDVSDKV